MQKLENTLYFDLILVIFFKISNKPNLTNFILPFFICWRFLFFYLTASCDQNLVLRS